MIATDVPVRTMAEMAKLVVNHLPSPALAKGILSVPFAAGGEIQAARKLSEALNVVEFQAYVDPPVDGIAGAEVEVAGTCDGRKVRIVRQYAMKSDTYSYLMQVWYR